MIWAKNEVLSRLKSPFFISYIPIMFYITRPYEWCIDRCGHYDNDYFIFFVIFSIVAIFFVCKKADSFFTNKIVAPYLLPTFYSFSVVCITVVFGVEQDEYHLVSKVIFIIFLGLLLLFFQKNNNAQGCIEKAKNDFLKLPIDEQNRLKLCIDRVVKNIEHQIKYIPANVLENEYIKKIFDAYLFYYSSATLIKEKFSSNVLSIALVHILDSVFNSDEKRIQSYNPNKIINDENFKNIPSLINLYINMPLENQTGLLVLIEAHLEKTTGKKVRFMSQFS